MSQVDTWMPLYIGDYMADTMHLTGAEHGAYLLLIMHYWRTGPLPDDDRKLAAIARTETKDWRVFGPTIREFFTKIDGCLHHTRIDREIERAGIINEQRSSAGKASAAQRALQRKVNGNSTGVEREAQRKSNENPTSVERPLESSLDFRWTHLHTQRKKDQESESKIPPKPPRGPRSMEADPECAAFYAAYPRHDAPDDAAKAWRQVTAAGAKPADIMAGLARYKFSDDPKYIKLPASWLRAGCWKSEAVTPPAERWEDPARATPSNPTGRLVTTMTGGF